ncbi:hypothetical protein DFJ74DRAFT_657918 [Hyaloraphidium curvatum]|nr:hypothetical protein DFJ74DRAFT_657918 [Hyaloraphidium curvatum]
MARLPPSMGPITIDLRTVLALLLLHAFFFTAFPHATHTGSSLSRQCSGFGRKVDVFVVAAHDAMPMLEALIRSLNLFMPCRGTLHIFADEPDLARVQVWAAGATLGNAVIRPFVAPPSFSDVEGYVLQSWFMFYADKYVSPTAEYVMFMDTDSLLSLPVTKKALMTSDGKLYLPGWDLKTATQFYAPCRHFLGSGCGTNFMAYFPFSMPKSSFARLRAAIEAHTKTDFDTAFLHWHASKSPAQRRTFSQFFIMGNYMVEFEPDRVEHIHCPHVTALKDTDACRHYVHPGFHYGWRTCQYVGSCRAGHYQIHVGDGKVFTHKLSMELMKYHEEVLMYGYCLAWRLKNPRAEDAEIPGGCTQDMFYFVHSEALTYPKLPQDFSFIKERFTPDY